MTDRIIETTKSKWIIPATVTFMAVFVSVFVWIATILINMQTDIAVIKRNFELQEKDNQKVERVLEDVNKIHSDIIRLDNKINNHIERQ